MTPTRILIVDDNPDNVTILRDRLQARGYETTVAHDGEQALAMIMALRPGTAGAGGTRGVLTSECLHYYRCID